MIDTHESDSLEDVFSADRIYCANCIHCKLVKAALGEGSQYALRVRCAAGKWRKKLGEEKIYKYFTVIRRTLDSCDSYVPMGEVDVFLKELRKSLPIKDEIYNP
jgi:hypothetical protein